MGRYFAQVAGLEAAAVDAFERMAAELQVLGAPVELVHARASAEDERRHTRDMGALAERFAVKPAVHEAQQFALRGLFEVGALENAVEGCVRETYGAVVGHHQARHAQDPVVRAGMARVAEDETRHAALSWAVAEWSLPQLTDAQRDVIRGAQRAAISALTRSVSIPEGPRALARRGSASARRGARDVAGARRAGLGIVSKIYRLTYSKDASFWAHVQRRRDA